MRVSCSRCETHYSIPAEKLESGPIKVRCKKCGHVFGVRKKAPRPEAEEAVQPLAPFAAAPTQEPAQAEEQPTDEVSWDAASEDEAGADETRTDTDDFFAGLEGGDEEEKEQTGEQGAAEEEKEAAGDDLDLGGFGEPEKDKQQGGEAEEEAAGDDLDLGGFGEPEEDEQQGGEAEEEAADDDLDLGGFGEPEEDEQQGDEAEEEEGDVDYGNVFADSGDGDSQDEEDVAAQGVQGEDEMGLSFTQEEDSGDSREEDETDGGDIDFGDPVDFGTDGEDDGGGEQEEEEDSLDFDLSSFAASTFGAEEEDEGKLELGDDDGEFSGTRDFDLDDFGASAPDEEEAGLDGDGGDDIGDYGDDEKIEDPFRQTDLFSNDEDGEDGDFLEDEKKKEVADEREDEDSLFDRVTDDFQPESMGGFGEDEEEEDDEEEDSKFSITSDADEQDEEDSDAPRLDLRRGSRGSEPPLEYPGVDRKEPKPVLKALIVALLMGTIAFVGYNLLVNPDAAFYLMKIPGINKLLEIPAINKLVGVETGHKSLKPVEPIKGAYFKRDGKKALYVISGWIMNKSPEAMSAVQVKGTIFDKAGDKVGESASFLASVLTEPELTAMDDKQISAKLAKGKLTVLNPGDKEVFMLVFANPPANVAKHKVEVVLATKATNEKDKK